jgi:3-oxoadipate enol-lactonase/4-carboxymuconolactone decarboxylase
LLIAGEHDALVPQAAADELVATLPFAKVERVPKAANLATLEQPGYTAKALLNHFGSAATLEAGFISRRVALGDPHVDKTIAAITPFTRTFQDFLTRYCWGEVWTRAGLSRRDRSLATIAAIVALGAEHEIPVHVRAGLRHGLKIEELPELYEQLALYTGLPRAFGALNITQRTLIEDGLLPAVPTPQK